mmetsp:Transcript_5662/g.10160  ORF Transcript_5662/g.10160 Transcript_5662/m.10160 type:complete len:561 (+) Transcript_5662:210-1892(+)
MPLARSLARYCAPHQTPLLSLDHTTRLLLLPHGVVPTVLGHLPPIALAGNQVTHVAPGAHLDGHIAVDRCEVHVMLSALDLDGGVGLDAVALPDGDELQDGLLEVLVVEQVGPEDAGVAGVREAVRIPQGNMVGGERPMVLHTTGVVVVNERDGHRWPPAQQTSGFAVSGEPPVLAVSNGVLQDALGGEVECGAGLLSAVDPVAQRLPGTVLVGTQPLALPVHVCPQLPDVERLLANGVLDVLAGIVGRVALHKVQPPAAVTHVLVQPVEPVLQRLAKLGVVVIQVGGSIEVRSAIGIASSAKDGVVAGDGPPVPVHATRVVCSIAAKAILLLVLILKVVPSALFVLRLGTPVVDDDVGHGYNISVVEGLQDGPEVLVRAVLGIHVVEDGWEIALGGYGLAGRGKPDVGNARLLDLLHHILQHVVPPAIALPALPVEPLEQNDVLLVTSVVGVFVVDQMVIGVDKGGHDVTSGGVLALLHGAVLVALVDGLVGVDGDGGKVREPTVLLRLSRTRDNTTGCVRYWASRGGRAARSEGCSTHRTDHQGADTNGCHSASVYLV